MSEIVQRIGAMTKDMVQFTLKGEPIINDRAKRIIAHYEREIAKGHMTLNTASECAVHDYLGRNSHD